MPSALIDTTALASDLRVVIGQLVRRLRAEHRLSLSHASVLGRLDRDGTSSIGDLARLERVRQQSMGQTIHDLEAEGLLARRPDHADRRRMLVELTDAGRSAILEDRRRREGWLARAIDEDLSAEEQRLLSDAAALLARLAEQ